MTRSARWIIGLLLALAGVAAALLAVLAWRVPDDRELAARIIAAAEKQYGVKLTVGAAHLQLWPRPQLMLEEVATTEERPLSVRRVVAHLRASELLRQKVSVESVEIEGAVVPQLALMRLRPKHTAAGSTALAIQQLRFRDLTWITRHGKELALEGSVRLDADAALRQARLVRTGAQPQVQLTLTRDGTDQWKVESRLGGGSADGVITIKRGEDGKLKLSGQLAPREIEVAGALQAFQVHSPVRGKASGQTELSASGDNVVALAASLHTSTTFSMASATLLRIDIDKAIRSFGKDRSGQTALRSLSGRMDTRNTPDGLVVRYTGLKAEGESFNARGEGTIAKRRIEGKATVDLVGGLVGVPVTISGPLAQPNVAVPTTALASTAIGAAVGTAVLPGVGTALGAKLGEMLGRPK